MKRQGTQADKRRKSPLPSRPENKVKGPGIVERVKAAKTKAAKIKLAREARNFEFISNKTLRRVWRAAKAN